MSLLVQPAAPKAVAKPLFSTESAGSLAYESAGSLASIFMSAPSSSSSSGGSSGGSSVCCVA